MDEPAAAHPTLAPSEREVTTHQRFIQRLTTWLGRPAVLYLVFSGVAAWVGVNLALPWAGLPSADPPPFALLQGLATLGGLFIATAVLITQNRQLLLSEKRSRLDLEINLTSERKIAKLIALVEELRRDLPGVRDRTDTEAEQMQARADPHAIAEALDQRIELEVSADLAADPDARSLGEIALPRPPSPGRQDER